MTKLVSVFGATGSQGGAVVRSLLKDGFKVRALTRNPDSDKGKELKSLGAEVVKCDDADTKEVIENAIKGSDGVFCVTNFWAYFDKELPYGKNMVDAAVSAGVKHFVFSGLSACKKISNGKISVPHFDIKHEIEQYIRELSKKNPSFQISFVYCPFYMQNLETFFTPKKSEDGKSYALTLPVDPSSKFPLDMGDINDLGPIVSAIMKDPSKFSGSIVPFSGSALTGDEIASAISKQTGKNVVFNYVPTDQFAKFGFPGAQEMANMFQFYNEYGAFHVQDKSIAPKLTKLTTFDEFLKKVNYKLE